MKIIKIFGQFPPKIPGYDVTDSFYKNYWLYTFISVIIIRYCN